MINHDSLTTVGGEVLSYGNGEGFLNRDTDEIGDSEIFVVTISKGQPSLVSHFLMEIFDGRLRDRKVVFVSKRWKSLLTSMIQAIGSM